MWSRVATVLIRCVVLCVLSVRFGEMQCIFTKPHTKNYPNHSLSLSHRGNFHSFVHMDVYIVFQLRYSTKQSKTYSSIVPEYFLFIDNLLSCIKYTWQKVRDILVCYVINDPVITSHSWHTKHDVTQSCTSLSITFWMGFPNMIILHKQIRRVKPPVFLYWPFQGGTSVVIPYCYLFLLSLFILWFSYYVSDIFCKF